MITITDKAQQKITNLLKEEGKSDHFVRVSVKAGGCSGLSYDLIFGIIFNGNCSGFLRRNKWKRISIQ